MTHPPKKEKYMVFMRFLVPYILFLLVPLFITLITYQQTISELEAEMTSKNVTILNHSKEIIDQRLAEIDSIAQQLVSNSTVQQFQYVSQAFEGNMVNRTLDLKKSLYDYTVTNNFIFDYFLVYPNNGTVMNSKNIYTLPAFYREYLNYDSMDMEQWKRSFLDVFHQRAILPAQGVNMNGKPYRFITYLHTLGYSSRFQGTLFILIEDKEIQKLLKGFDISDGGWAYIANEQGEIVSYITDDADKIPADIPLQNLQGIQQQSIDGTDVVVTYTTSSYNKWKYVVVQPSHIMMKRIDTLKNTIRLFIITSLIVGLLLALLFAYRNSAALRLLIRTLRERFEGEQHPTGSVYGFIQATVLSLIQSNKELQEEMKAQIPFLRAAYLERLFKGELLGQQDLTVMQQHIGMEIRGNNYVVVLLLYRDYDQLYIEGMLEELDMKRVWIKDVLNKVIQAGEYIHDITEDKIALLISSAEPFTAECQTEIEGRIEQIKQALAVHSLVNPVFAVGRIYPRLLDVWQSYEEANQALNVSMRSMTEDVIWFEDISRKSNHYHFPSEVETRMLSYIKAGNQQEVDKLMGELYEENFVQRDLSLNMLRVFLYELWGGFIKVAEQVSAEDDSIAHAVQSKAFELLTYKDMKRFYQYIFELYRKVSDEANRKKKSHNERLTAEIVTLLQQTYTDPHLSLSSISSHFAISEVYLSQFFKEQTGINFSDYLESLRMTRAMELLATSNLSVYEIANQVGYNLATSFSRAFKRTHGMSASAYRSSATKARD
ncbi:helix-turn-helix domain-containing protein [Paenibacillus sp. FSL H8-0034]|uniref:helix-turn-helix domain-containing protein n=1 Tax=Paenibacillus sp. FSL H8-0034 TaxID=2954671 RepID=UPI0030FA5EF6